MTKVYSWQEAVEKAKEDREDGLLHAKAEDYVGKPMYPSAPKRRTTITSAGALAGRDKAKFLGGKALTGTLKQKVWAEKIRADKLEGMDDAAATLAVKPAGLGKTAKFWIENRDKSGAEIGAFFKRLAAILEEMGTARGTPRGQELVDEYNGLTAKFGF